LSGDVPEIQALSELELQFERERYHRAAAMIREPLFHLGGALAFLLLLDAEVHDLAVILEGHSLGLGQGEMAQHLLRPIEEMSRR